MKRMADRAEAARARVKAYRLRQREAGMKLVQYWVPDVSSSAWRERVRLQCLAANVAADEAEAQDFIDSHLDELLSDVPPYSASV